MSSNNQTLPKISNTIHIRDFIIDICPDTTLATSNNEFRCEVNIFNEDFFEDHTVAVEPIDAEIHVYLKDEELEPYIPNAFIYVIGSFSTVKMTDNKLKLIVHSLSIARYDCYATQIHRTIYYLTLSFQTSW